MELKKLDKKTVIQIFDEHIINDFPKSEIRPLKSMLKLYDKKQYICFGLYDKVLIGYAFFVLIEGKEYLLLDYFAIISGNRNSGIGSIFIKKLQYKLAGYLILAEVEKAQGHHMEEIEIRKKRINFYLKNDFKFSDITCHLFGVDYHILYYSHHQELDNKKIYDYLDSIYHSLYDPIAYHLFVKINN